MKPGWPLAVSILLVAASSSPALAEEPAGPVGNWTFQKKRLIATATTYTDLRDDGSCSQASRVSVAGTIHWLTVRCTWSIIGGNFAMRIVDATDEDLVGTTSSVRVVSISEASMVYEKDGKLETWVRVENLPADFVEHMFLRQPQGVDR